jgi:hypothetical protein
MDNTINVLQSLTKISYLSGYSTDKVISILVANMKNENAFHVAANMLLNQAKYERQQKLKDEIADLKVGGNATKKWKEFVEQLSANIKDGDIDNFLRWPVITQTMFVSQANYLGLERAYIEDKNVLIEESKVGNPPSDGNLIHQAYHLARFMDATGEDVRNYDYIFEFGGGYGCLCRLINELGFSGDYVIYDLSHFSALQRYYLDSCRIDAEYVSEIWDSKKLLLKTTNNSLQLSSSQIPTGKKSLFIAVWSLSETPLKLREKVDLLLPHFDSFLLAYQNTFEGIDNVAYFNEVKKLDRKWTDIKIDHIPANRYLFGSKV